MHERTQRLHQLMKQHGLKPADVAKMMNRSTETVRIWRVKASDNRVIPADALQVLELTLSGAK